MIQRLRRDFVAEGYKYNSNVWQAPVKVTLHTKRSVKEPRSDAVVQHRQVNLKVTDQSEILRPTAYGQQFWLSPNCLGLQC
jgi:hypothetical protein